MLRAFLSGGLFIGAINSPAAPANAFQPDTNMWQKYLVPSGEVVTPHIPWYKPGHGKKARVLFVVSRHSEREVVELAQRMDLDYQVFAVADAGRFFVEPYISSGAERAAMPAEVSDPAAMAKSLQAKLENSYDLIALGAVDWKSLPISAKYSILKQVSEGTTLLTGRFGGGDEYFGRAISEKMEVEFPFLYPYKGLPAYAKYSNTTDFVAGTMDGFRLGKGRIIRLKNCASPQFQAFTPPATGNPLDASLLDYDYYCALVIHLIRTGIGSPPQYLIKGSDYIKAENNNLPKIEFCIESKIAKKVVGRFVLRDRENRVMAAREKSCALIPGTNKVEFEVGAVPAGQYFADLWVLDQSKIDNFGSAYVEVTSASSIAGIDLNKTFRKGDEVKGKIALALASPAKDLALVVYRRDNYGRVTGEQTFPIKDQKTIEFSFPAGTPLSVLQYIETELRQAGRVIDRKKVFYSIADLYLKTDDICLHMWGYGEPGSYLGKYYYEVLRRAGVDIAHSWEYSEWECQANIYHLFYATHFSDTKKNHAPDDHIRVPCLNDPQYRKSEAENLAKKTKHFMPYANQYLSMGDETMFANNGSLTEICFCSLCVSNFHAVLKNEYQTLENLNKEYQSSYASFEEVKPVTLEDVRKDAKLAPLWVDYRRHMESTWADMFRFCRDSAKKVHPDAEVGYECSDMFVNSYQTLSGDFYKMSRIVRVNNPYGTDFPSQAVPDLRAPDALVGIGCMGACDRIQRTPAAASFSPWHYLFHGANFYFVHMAAPGSSPCGMMAPDLVWYDFFKITLEQMKEIKSGPGKLLLSCKKEDDRTALLYSASSVHAATIAQQKTGVFMEAVLKSDVRLMKEVGRHLKVVAYQQVAEGILEKEGFRCLILPFAQALSPAEVKNITEFVRNGGTMIADLRPGVDDEHGKPCDKGALDEVFGVKHNPAVPAYTNTTVAVKAEGFPGAFPRTLVDASLQVNGGKALAKAGEAPALIINNFGKGKAILLNFAIADYLVGGESYPRLGPDAPAILEFFKALCTLAGLEEKFQADPVMPGLRRYRFTSGSATYLGLMHDMPGVTYFWGMPDLTKPQTPTVTKITLPAEAHVYNVREAKYLGYTSQINASIPIGGAQLFALLPYKVEALQLIMPAKVTPGDDLEYRISLKTGKAEAGLHVYRFVLISPDGVERECYTQNIRADKGIAEGKLTLALNEQPGTWKCVIKDTATGIKAEKQFKVREK